jgi:DNA processing protein
VLEDLRYVLPAPPEAVPSDEPEGEESALLAALGFDPMGLDALVARTGIPASLLQAQLLELELAGQIARLPGGMFQRLARA